MILRNGDSGGCQDSFCILFAFGNRILDRSVGDWLLRTGGGGRLLTVLVRCEMMGMLAVRWQ